MSRLRRLLLFGMVAGLCLILTACYIPPDEISDTGTTGSGSGGALNFRTLAPTTAVPTASPTPPPENTVNWDPWGSATTSPGTSPSITAPVIATTPPIHTIEVVTPRPTSTPTPAPTSIKKGASGAAVRQIQQRLKALGYYSGTVDGDFGAGTESAVKAFQRANGLTADGKVGEQTLAKLNSSKAVKATAKPTAKPTARPTAKPTAKPTARPTATPRPTAKPNTDKYIRSGASGSDVRTLQNRLISLGWLAGSADGKYGNATMAAVKAFQKAGKLWSDGVAGPDTLTLLYSSSAPRSDSAVASTGEKLREGAEGQAVRALQKRLRTLGYYKGSVDGSYGKETTAAVMSFQLAHGLTADGVAGTDTLSLLYADEDSSSASSSRATATPKPSSSSSSISSTGYITLEEGSYGDSVRNLQTRLKKLGYYNGSVDGKYGNATVSAVIAFQQSHNLTVDGKAGPATQRALYSTSSGRTTYSTIRPGDRGSAVRNLQYTLYELGYYDGSVDGIYGDTTSDAVRAFQIRNKLTPVDGIAGNRTLQKLYSSSAIPEQAPNSSYTTLREGEASENVLEMKDALIQLGYPATRDSSTFDAQTVEALKLFQQKNGLTPDGVAGPATLKKLYSSNPVANN